MAFDSHRNFAYSTVTTPPAPAASGTSLQIASGDGALFPNAPFNATVAPFGVLPRTTNAEIVRVTGVAGDTFTIVRMQEGSQPRTIQAGDQIAATITARALQDIEAFPDLPRLSLANTFASPQGISDAVNARLYLRDLSQVANARMYAIANAGSYLFLAPVDDTGTGQGPGVGGAERVVTIDRGANLRVSGDVYEKQRPTPMGHWINVPFNAANFEPAGQWVVEPGDISQYAYAIVGRTMLVAFYGGTMTIAGSPMELRLRLPVIGATGFSAFGLMFWYYDNAGGPFGGWNIGYAQSFNGDPWIRFYKNPGGSTPFGNVPNNAYVV